MPSQKHKLDKLFEEWDDCDRCPLYRTRRQVVLGRGDLRPHLMLVGEGPGKTEDLLGEPFVGSSGRLLNTALDAAVGMAKIPHPEQAKFFFTNVVGCRPTDAKGAPNRPPRQDEAWACMERVVKTERIVQPALILLLGAVPKRLLGRTFPGARHLPHPAAVLRMGGVGTGMYTGYVRDLSACIEDADKIISERVNARKAVRPKARRHQS